MQSLKFFFSLFLFYLVYTHNTKLLRLACCCSDYSVVCAMPCCAQLFGATTAAFMSCVRENTAAYTTMEYTEPASLLPDAQGKVQTES